MIYLDKNIHVYMINDKFIKHIQKYVMETAQY